MKLVNVVSSLLENENIKISNKDIKETVLYLLGDTVLDDVRVLKKIHQEITLMVGYENARVE